MKNSQNSSENTTSAFHRLGRILYGLIFVVLLVTACLVVVSTMNIKGNYKLLVVRSGSMEPSISKGAIIVIKPADTYKINDVITIQEPSNPKVSVTHRITEIEKNGNKILYVTKGDANKGNDTEKRLKENIRGKVLFSIPLLGYPVTFAKTQIGLILLVIVPTTLIVYGELVTIKNETVRLVQERKKRKLSTIEKVEVEIGTKEIKAEKGIMKFFRNIFRKVKTST